jgi:transposase
MFVLHPNIRVFLCTLPADMRRGFDGLAAMTRDVVAQNPLSGHLFVFRNRTGNRLKILYWEGAGYCLVYRRLEKGTYRFPPAPTAGQAQGAASVPQPASLEIDGGDLAMILEGIELESARRHKRFELPANAAATP